MKYLILSVMAVMSALGCASKGDSKMAMDTDSHRRLPADENETIIALARKFAEENVVTNIDKGQVERDSSPQVFQLLNQPDQTIYEVRFHNARGCKLSVDIVNNVVDKNGSNTSFSCR